MKKIFILLLTTFMLISCSSGYLGKYSVDYIKLSDGTEAAVNGSMRVYENRIEFDDMDTKLLQKSEMRKNMVMDLIYRGFIYAANYSESHYNPRRSQIKTELRYLFVTTLNR